MPIKVDSINSNNTTTVENRRKSIKTGKQVPIPSSNPAEILNSKKELAVNLGISEDFKGYSLLNGGVRNPKFLNYDNPATLMSAFAHINSDSILNGTSFEGNRVEASCDLLLQFLEDYHEVGDVCDVKQNPLASVIRKLKGLRDQIKMVDYLKITSLEQIKEKAEIIENAIKALSIGESYVMKGGWSGRPGHAMLYEFVKKDKGYDLIIYNTGAGAENYHASLFEKGKEKIRPILHYKNIRERDLFFYRTAVTNSTCVLEELIALNVPPDNIEEFKNRAYGSKDIYERILGHLKITSEDTAVDAEVLGYMTAQRSGTCSWRVLTALMYTELKDRPDLYKKLKYDIKLQSLVVFYQKMADTLKEDTVMGSQARILLKNAAEKLFRATAKRYNPSEGVSLINQDEALAAYATACDILQKVEEAENHLMQVRRQKNLKVDWKALDPALPNPEIKVDIVKPTVLKENIGLTLPSLSVRPAPENLITSLKKVLEEVEVLSRRDGHKKLAQTYLESFIKCLPCPNSSEGKSYWNEVPSILECMRGFDELLSCYSKLALVPKASFPEEIIAAWEICAIEYYLAVVYDSGLPNGGSNLENHCVDFSYFLETTQSVSNQAILFNPETAERFNQVSAYFKKESDSKDANKRLFSIAKYKEIKNDSDELRYYVELLSKHKRLRAQVEGSVYPKKIDEEYDSFTTMQLSALNLMADVSLTSDAEGKPSFLKNAGFEHLVLLKRSALCGNIFLSNAFSSSRVNDLKIEHTKKTRDAICLNVSFGAFSSLMLYSNSMESMLRPVAEGKNGETVLDFIRQMKLLMSRTAENEFLKINKTDEQGLASYKKTKFDYWAGTKEKEIFTRFLDARKMMLASSEGSKLIPFQLLYFFRDNCDKLDSSDVQTVFESLFFDTPKRDFKLGEEFKQQEGFETNPLVEQCRSFVLKGLDHWSRLRRRPDIHASLFFVRFAQRVGHFVEDKTWSLSVLEFLDQTLKSAMNPPLTPEERRAIHLHRLTHFAHVRELKEEDALKMVESWVYIKQYPAAIEGGWADPEMERWARELFISHQPFIKKVLKESEGKRSACLTAVLKNAEGVPQEISGLKWVEEGNGYPCFKCQHEKETWSLNIVTGQLQSSELGLLSGGKTIEDPTPQYLRIFGSRRFACRDSNGTLSFEDKGVNGRVRIIKNQTIQRQFSVKGENKWFQNIDIKNVSDFLPSSLLADHTHWASTGKIRYFIFANKETGEPVYVMLPNQKILAWGDWVNGGFKVDCKPDISILTRLSEVSQLGFLEKFEKKGYIQTWEKENSLEQLIFSRYQSLTGQSLSFERSQEGDALVWTDKKQFVLGTQTEGLLGKCSNYLLLTSQKGDKRKLVVPLQKVDLQHCEDLSQNATLDVCDSEKQEEYQVKGEYNVKQKDTHRYLEFDIADDGTLSCSATEGDLFLAYLFLAQRDYRTALFYLKRVTQSSFLSTTSQEIMGWILNTGKALNDQSPNAVALRLHAAKTLYNYEKSTEKASGKANVAMDWSSISKDYKGYLDSLKNVDIELKLSEKDDEPLLLKKVISHEIFVRREKELISSASQSLKVVTRSSLGNSDDKRALPDLRPLPYVSDKYPYPAEYLDSFMKYKADAPLIDKCFVSYYIYAKMNDAQVHKGLKYKLNQIAPYVTGVSSERLALLDFAVRYPHLAPAYTLRGEPSNNEIWVWYQSLYEAYSKRPEEDKIAVKSFFEKKETVLEKFSSFAVTAPIEEKQTLHGLSDQIVNHWTLDINPDVIVLKDYFIEVPKEKSQGDKQPQKILPVSKNDVDEKKQEFLEASQSAFDAFYEDLAKGAEENAKVVVYDIKSIATSRLIHDVTGRINAGLNQSITIDGATYDNLEILRREIENLANTKNMLSIPIRIRETLLENGLIREKLNLPQLICLYLKGDVGSYVQTNPYLGDRKLEGRPAYEVLDKMIGIYLEKSTQIQQLQRALEIAQKVKESEEGSLARKALVQQLVGELQEKRHYNVGPGELERAFVVFEYQANMRLRSKQCTLIQKMLETDAKGNYSNIIVQLIMGGGKTAVLASILMQLTAKKKKLALFMTPAAQFESVKDNLRSSQKTNFGQEIDVIDFPRAGLKSTENLELILDKLQTAVRRADLVMMKSEMAQSLQLEWLSLIRQQAQMVNKDKELSANIILLQNILLFIKQNGAVLMDEVDMLLDIHLEVNFPEGEADKVPVSRLDLFKEVFTALIHEGEGGVADLVGLRANRQGYLSAKDYKEKVQPYVALHLATYDDLLLKEKDKASFQRFISNQMEPIIQGVVTAKTPEQVSTKLQNIKTNISEAQAKIKALKADKSATESLIAAIEREESWVKSQQKNYIIFATLTNNSIDEEIVTDVERPTAEDFAFFREDLEFLSLLEEKSRSLDEKEAESAHLIALSKYILEVLLPICFTKQCDRNFGRSNNPSAPGEVVPYKGVGCPSSTRFGNHYEAVCYHFMTALIEGVSEKQIGGLAYEMSEAATFFCTQSREEFEKTAEAIEFKALTGVDLIEMDQVEKKKLAADNVNQDVSKILAIEMETISQHVTYNKRRLSSTPLSLVNMFDSVRSFSGTPWNHASFEESLAKNISLDKGTEGKIFDILLERAAKNPHHMHVIEETSPKKLLEQVLKDHRKQKNVRGIIDSGAVFTGKSNFEVSQDILEYLSTLPDNTIDGVLFFHRIPDPTNANQMIEKLALLKKSDLGEPIIVIIGGTRLDDITAKKEDIENIFVYYDERHSTGTDIPQFPDSINLLTVDPGVLQRNIGQGMLRLRQYFLGQDIEFVIPKATQSTLLNNGQTLGDVIRTAIFNQALRKAEDAYRSYRAKLKEIVRKAAMDSLLGAVDEDVLVDRFRNFQEILVQESSDSPYEQYGKLKQEEITIKSLEALRDRLKGKLSAQFSDKEVTDIEEKMEKLLDSARSSSILQKYVKESSETTLGTEQELQVEVSVEQEIEIEQELLLELQAYQNIPFIGYPKEQENFDFLIHYLYDKNRIKPAYIQELNDTFDRVFAADDDNALPLKYRRFKGIFSNNILVTENFRLTTNQALPVFHHAQKPGYQILMIKKPEPVGMMFVLVSQEEANFLRQKVREAKSKNACYCLMQPDGSLLEGNDKFPTEEVDLAKMERALVEINAFNGNIRYLNEHPKATEAWMQADAEKRVPRSDFLKISAYRESKEQYRCAMRLPFIDGKTGDSSFVGKILKCKERRDYEKMRSSDLAKKSPEEIGVLDPSSVPYILHTQVPHLKTKAQCAQLREKQVQSVEPTQVNLLPTTSLRYLNKKTQLAEIDTKLDPNEYLASIQVKNGLCNAQQLNRLTKRELVDAIPGQQVKFLDEKMVDSLKKPAQIKALEELNKILRVKGDALRHITTVQIEKVVHAEESYWSSKPAELPSKKEFLTTLANAVPDEDLPKISPKLVPYLTKIEKVKKLETPAQIQAIDPSLDPNEYLSPQQIKKGLCSAEQLDRLTKKDLVDSADQITGPGKAKRTNSSSSVNKNQNDTKAPVKPTLFSRVKKFCQGVKVVVFGFVGAIFSLLAIFTGIYALRNYRFFGAIWKFFHDPVDKMRDFFKNK